MPDLRYTITKHPIGGLKPDQVRARAADMVGETVEAVSSHSSAASRQPSAISVGD